MTFQEKIRKAWEEFCSTCPDYYWEQGGTIWQYLRDCEDESIEELDRNLYKWIVRIASNGTDLTAHGGKLLREQKAIILILCSYV